MLRSLIKKHALTLGEEEEDSDDEFDFDGEEKITADATKTEADIESVPPEYRFLAEGAFTFFLDECDTRVTRKQEKTLEGLEYVARACLVRDEDLPESMRPKSKSAKSVGSPRRHRCTSRARRDRRAREFPARTKLRTRKVSPRRSWHARRLRWRRRSARMSSRRFASPRCCGVCDTPRVA